MDLNGFLFLYESIREKNKGSEEIESDDLNAFKVFDKTGDGFISYDELQNVLVRWGLWNDERCGGGGDNYCRRMINAFDIDLDGRLDFQEFKNMFMSSSNSSSYNIHDLLKWISMAGGFCNVEGAKSSLPEILG